MSVTYFPNSSVPIVVPVLISFQSPSERTPLLPLFLFVELCLLHGHESGRVTTRETVPIHVDRKVIETNHFSGTGKRSVPLPLSLSSSQTGPRVTSIHPSYLGLEVSRFGLEKGGWDGPSAVYSPPFCNHVSFPFYGWGSPVLEFYLVSLYNTTLLTFVMVQV